MSLRVGMCAIALVLAAIAPAFAASEGSDSTWLAEIRSLEATYGGHLGMMAENLRTGEAIGYNASERFPTASVIKLPIMAAFFAQVDSGNIDPGQRVVLTKEDKKPGSGILQFLASGAETTLLDAVKLMIVLSDNTATNLVLDRMGRSHDERLAMVNGYLVSQGLKNTRLLNRLYSWSTKKNSPEGIRYGIGVSTPEDMVTLLTALYRRTLASPASCEVMLEILKEQFYDDMIPRYLPGSECDSLVVAHKTGGVNETKVDVGLILSDRADIALAIFVDKHPDHMEGSGNRGVLLAAAVARVAWNHFTGMRGMSDRKVDPGNVDWTRVPGGSWAIYRSSAAPFPHPDRANGFVRNDGTVYPWFPHYADSSIIVFVPEGFHEVHGGSNLIVHFHGHLSDNLNVLERDSMLQAMTAQKINALLVLVQGPYRARDSFGGKMEDPGGFRRLVEDVLKTMQREKIVTNTGMNRICVSGFSGGYRPAAFVLDRGGLSDRVTDVFLFDALYGNEDFFRNWFVNGSGHLFGAYTEHLSKEYEAFEASVHAQAGDRLSFTRTAVPHELVPRTFIALWLSLLSPEWKLGHEHE
jgi:beta-lactamase class A